MVQQGHIFFSLMQTQLNQSEHDYKEKLQREESVRKDLEKVVHTIFLYKLNGNFIAISFFSIIAKGSSPFLSIILFHLMIMFQRK